MYFSFPYISFIVFASISMDCFEGLVWPNTLFWFASRNCDSVASVGTLKEEYELDPRIQLYEIRRTVVIRRHL